MGQDSKLATASSRPVGSTGDRCAKKKTKYIHIFFNGFYDLILHTLTVESLVDAGPKFHLVQLTISVQFIAIVAANASGKLHQR